MKKLFIVLFSIFTICSFSKGQNLRVKDKILVDDSGENIILRGMGLGGWMLQEPYMLQLGNVARTQTEIRKKIEEAIGKEKTNLFYENWLNNHVTRTDIDSMKSWGFNSVRLPMHYNLFTPPIQDEPVAGEITWLEKGFVMTDSLLKWCSENEIYLILDLHAAPGGQGTDRPICDYNPELPSLWESERNQVKTIELWTKLAERYKDEPWLGGYDLINEPNWSFEESENEHGCEENSNIPLRELLIRITKAIRKIDKQHIIIIEGNCWGNNYEGMFPLWDSNMVMSFHKYWSFNDQSTIQYILDYREKYNAPIWLGESGENSNVWFRDAIKLVEDNQIGWAWWPLKKLGFNNILQIPKNEGYAELVNYWEGKEHSSNPGKEASFQALMQLAEDLKIENNLFHPDVVDAMFRQTNDDSVQPFKAHKFKNEYRLFAVDYDLGREGVAYKDSISGTYWVSTGERTSWNDGRVYRNDGVDIQICTDDVTNGYAVTGFHSGEWLHYTITAEKTGKYNLLFRVSADSPKNELLLEINGEKINNITIPNKYGVGEWEYSVIKGVSLNNGDNSIKISAKGKGISINYIEFFRR